MNLGDIFGGADYDEVGSVSSYCSSGDSGYSDDRSGSSGGDTTDYETTDYETTDSEDVTMGTWSAKMGRHTSNMYNRAIEAIMRRDFEVLSLILPNINGDNRGDHGALMILVQFFYNNVPR